MTSPKPSFADPKAERQQPGPPANVTTAGEDQARLSIHPFAEIFPLADGPQMHQLRDDLKENGLREPITTWIDPAGKNWLLDGRRRETCCIALNIPLRYYEFHGSEQDALAYVISKNLTRRHLTLEERAFIAAKLATMTIGRNKPTNTAPAVFISQAQAAEKMNVSVDTVQRAKEVATKGVPELVDAAKLA